MIRVIGSQAILMVNFLLFPYTFLPSKTTVPALNLYWHWAGGYHKFSFWGVFRQDLTDCASFLGFLPPFSSEREIVLCSYRWKTCHFPMLSCRKLLKKCTCFQNVCPNLDVCLNEIFVSWRLSKSFLNQGVVNSKRLVVVLNT